MDTNVDSGSPAVSSTPTPEASAPAPSAAPDISTTQPSQDASAPPSSATQGDTKEDLLSAVMKVVKTDPNADKVVLPGDTPAPDPTQSATPDQSAAPTEDELSDDPSREEMERYHSRTRKRIDKLLEQRNAARQESEALKADAQVATGLRQYLQQNDIAKEDFSVLLDLGAALRKGDFRTFYEGVRPYVELAEEALGVRIPADLQQQVQQGQMTSEAARYFAQERMARQLAESNAQRASQYASQQAQVVQQAQSQQQMEALQASIKGAVAAWENTARQADPDYAHKQDAVKNMLWAVVNERGAPQSPEQAVEIAKEAYRRANDMVSRFAPKPRATAPSPSSVNRNSGATPEPKSLMEAAMLGLSKSRRSA
jgi:hypothetical protein